MPVDTSKYQGFSLCCQDHVLARYKQLHLVLWQQQLDSRNNYEVDWPESGTAYLQADPADMPVVLNALTGVPGAELLVSNVQHARV